MLQLLDGDMKKSKESNFNWYYFIYFIIAYIITELVFAILVTELDGGSRTLGRVVVFVIVAILFQIGYLFWNKVIKKR